MKTLVIALTLSISACCITPILPDWIGDGQCMPPVTEDNAEECRGPRQFTDADSGLSYCCPEECMSHACNDRIGGDSAPFYCVCPAAPVDPEEGIWCGHSLVDEEHCLDMGGDYEYDMCWKSWGPADQQ